LIFISRAKSGVDLFVEVSTRKIGGAMLSKILNLHSALSNLEPPLKFELIVVGPAVDVSTRKALKGFLCG
jgi:hypothetical protein